MRCAKCDQPNLSKRRWSKTCPYTKLTTPLRSPCKKSIVQIGQRVFAIKTGPSRFLDGKIGPSRFLLSSSDLDCIWHDLQVILASHRIRWRSSIKGHSRLSKVQTINQSTFYLSFTLVFFNLLVVHLLIQDQGWRSKHASQLRATGQHHRPDRIHQCM